MWSHGLVCVVRHVLSCLCSFRSTGGCCSLWCTDVWYAKLMWSTLGHIVCGEPCPVLFLAAALVVDVARRCIQVPSLVSTPWAPPLIVVNIAVSRSLKKLYVHLLQCFPGVDFNIFMWLKETLYEDVYCYISSTHVPYESCMHCE